MNGIEELGYAGYEDDEEWYLGDMEDISQYNNTESEEFTLF